MASRAVVFLCVVVIAPKVLAQPGVFGMSVQSNGDDHLYKINLNTGATTDLGLVGFADAEGVSFGPGGGLYAIGGSVEEFWNITAPPGVMVGPTGARDGIDAGLSYDSSRNKMFNLNGALGGSFLYEIDINSGQGVFVGQSAGFADGLAIRAGKAFAADFVFDDALFSVDLNNGTQTMIGPLNIGDPNSQSGLSFDPGGTLWAITSDGRTFTLDTNTGQATFIANVDIGGGWEGLAIVPEPASLSLLIVGGLALSRRRR